jgi:hypothetical protein
MNKFGTYLQYLVLDVGFGVMSNFFLLEFFYNLMTGGGGGLTTIQRLIFKKKWPSIARL